MVSADCDDRNVTNEVFTVDRRLSVLELKGCHDMAVMTWHSSCCSHKRVSVYF